MKSNTSFVQNGNIFVFNDNSANQIHDELPAANYIIKASMKGLYLERVDAFPALGKLYGNIVKQTGRVLNTFMDRPGSTGVLFAGEKGSGKSMLAKNISIEAAKVGIPTLIINEPLLGDAFNSFIQSIHQPAVVFFDEFEKVYNSEEQKKMLTLLDGSFPTKKLFVLTCNDRWRIDDHMRNRPGRIYYMIDFSGLDSQFIREYCEDNLNNKEYIDKVVMFSSFFYKFNFDMLKAIVEEMNRYNETPQEVITILNTKVEYAGKQRYIADLYLNNVLVSKNIEDLDGNGKQREVHINPIVDCFEMWYYPDTGNPEKDEENGQYLMFKPTDLIGIDPVKETSTYVQGPFKAVLTKKKEVTYSVFDTKAL